MKISLNTNIDLGYTLRNSNNPNDAFNKEFSNVQSIKIYTDGSKNSASKSVGSACVCPELNVIKTKSIINKASIFTAECIALSDALDIALEYSDRNVDIFTDSLSLVLALNSPKNKTDINFHVLEIRHKYLTFLKKSSGESSITIYWVPSHVGILGNELADEHAKLATNYAPTVKHIPYSDHKQHFKKFISNQTLNRIQNEAKIKGKKFFSNYYQNSPKPWFIDPSLGRDLIVFICRCCSNHHSLKQSLHRINVVSDAICDCEWGVQDLNHLIWQCPLFDNERKHLMRDLRRAKQYPPLDISSFLVKPNIHVMQLVLKFLTKCNVKI
ncbi:uncharacterized protein LOC131672376 [Phymastichus coffea]|uniref:uncharacterized protein LOC131672376 n=1 Tax=Phymastichus coffea TaxID=108790 RepID=UPI00273CB92B|nr:uncharacterized protein LOC131672376 [Phymastichus coffea]